MNMMLHVEDTLDAKQCATPVKDDCILDEKVVYNVVCLKEVQNLRVIFV